jgi:hypothetical protein
MQPATNASLLLLTPAILGGHNLTGPPGSCSAPAPNSCTFYSACLEARFHCGPSGYPLGYGLRYCDAFAAVRGRFSAAGQAWIGTVMLCLQDALVPYETGAEPVDGCAALKEAAFATHPVCYVRSGVCTLPVADWEVLVHTIGLEQLLGSWDAVEQVLRTAEGCAGLYGWLVLKGLQHSVV